jgi:hypothetical protein
MDAAVARPMGESPLRNRNERRQDILGLLGDQQKGMAD